MPWYQMNNPDLVGEAAQHILTSHPAAPGSILDILENLFPSL